MAGGFVPIRTSLPPAPEHLLLVIRCNCQTDCSIHQDVHVRSTALSALLLVVTVKELAAQTCHDNDTETVE